jgi:hypothetical protein
MLEYFKVTNHLGESLLVELRNPETSGFFVRGIDGLGPAKGIVNTTEVLSADGAFYNSSRISSRNLVFNLGFYDTPNLTIEDMRIQTYRFFPMKRLLTFEFQTATRYGLTTGYVESNEPDIFSKEEGAVISVICPSAFFYGGSPALTYFTGIESTFEFPFSNESTESPLIEFGHVFIDTQKSVFYTGDEETGVTIYINVTGNVNNLAVHNATRSQTMEISSAQITAITGSNLIAGDQIIISTTKGNKHVYLIRSGVTYNILNAIDVNADWFTIERGDNVFTYTADSGLANLQFVIEYRVIYKGL